MNILRRGLGDAGYDMLLADFQSRAVDPVSFSKIRPGRSFPNPLTCLKIQCGAITQDQAGVELLADCSFAGFAGAQSCADPLCAPYCGLSAQSVARASQPLPVAPRVAELVLALADESGRGCGPGYWGSKFSGPYYADEVPCGCSSFISEHPILSVLLLSGVAYGIYRWRAGL